MQLAMAMRSFALLLIRWSRVLLQLLARVWAISGGLCGHEAYALNPARWIKRAAVCPEPLARGAGRSP